MIASNRGPTAADIHAPRGCLTPGGGGLVTGNARSLRGSRGVWVFAMDGSGNLAAAVSAGCLPGSDVVLHQVAVNPNDFGPYYVDICNGLLWPVHLGLRGDPHGCVPPLVHDLAEAWEAYLRVNTVLADYCDRHLDKAGQAFIHDLHLALVPSMLHRRRPDAGIAHFTHSPWAEPEEFGTLPAVVREPLLAAMLEADLLSFYVPRWAHRFLRCCESAGQRVDWNLGAVEGAHGRQVPVRAYPLGVDGDALRLEATREVVQRHRRRLRDLAGDRSLVVRVERADPAKNVVRGLQAFERLLEENPDLHGRVVQFALTYVTRASVPGYTAYADSVREKTRDINRRFRTPTWEPIVLEDRPDYALGLAAMSLADVLVVNSLGEGMNLVAKEGPAVNDRDCVLILSATTGSADGAGDAALLVDPLDIAALGDALRAALSMPAAERRERAECLRRSATALPPTTWLQQQRRDLRAARDGSWLQRSTAGHRPAAHAATAQTRF